MDELKTDFISPMKLCPWCGTTEGHFQRHDLPAEKSVMYRYFHVTSVCPVRIYTKWHNTESECIDDWNNRMGKDD